MFRSRRSRLMVAGSDRLSRVSVGVVTVSGSRTSPSRMIVACVPEKIVAHDVSNIAGRANKDIQSFFIVFVL